jgi:F0F1-type ATP synthase assembly protein I
MAWSAIDDHRHRKAEMMNMKTPQLYLALLAGIALIGAVACTLTNKTVPTELWTLVGVLGGGVAGVTIPSVANGSAAIAAPTSSSSSSASAPTVAAVAPTAAVAHVAETAPVAAVAPVAPAASVGGP